MNKIILVVGLALAVVIAIAALSNPEGHFKVTLPFGFEFEFGRDAEAQPAPPPPGPQDAAQVRDPDPALPPVIERRPVVVTETIVADVELAYYPGQKTLAKEIAAALRSRGATVKLIPREKCFPEVSAQIPYADGLQEEADKVQEVAKDVAGRNYPIRPDTNIGYTISLWLHCPL